MKDFTTKHLEVKSGKTLVIKKKDKSLKTSKDPCRTHRGSHALKGGDNKEMRQILPEWFQTSTLKIQDAVLHHRDALFRLNKQA